MSIVSGLWLILQWGLVVYAVSSWAHTTVLMMATLLFVAVLISGGIISSPTPLQHSLGEDDNLKPSCNMKCKPMFTTRQHVYCLHTPEYSSYYNYILTSSL